MDRGNGGNGRHDKARNAAESSAFDRHVAGVPGGTAFVLQTFVVLVENDDCSDTRARRPDRASRTDDDIDALRRALPIVGHESDRQTLTAQSTSDGSGLGNPGAYDKCSSTHQRRLEYGSHGTTGRPHHDPTSTLDKFIDVGQGSPRRRTHRRRCWTQGLHTFWRRRNGKHGTKGPCKTTGTPLCQADNFGSGARRQQVDHRFEVVAVRLGVDGFENPSVDTPTVQLDANDAAHGNIAEALGNDVIEGLVDPTDIGDDANGAGQSLSAAFSASRRLNCSQVNSGRLRPK
jgi:hypothetical protein